LISNCRAWRIGGKYDRDWTMEFCFGGVPYFNRYAPESLIQNQVVSYNDLITPEYRELIRQEWQRVIAQKRPFNYEYEITTANGEHKWVLEMGEAVYDEQGQVETHGGNHFRCDRSMKRLPKPMSFWPIIISNRSI
jgi:PAS domain-containing protein